MITQLALLSSFIVKLSHTWDCFFFSVTTLLVQSFQQLRHKFDIIVLQWFLQTGQFGTSLPAILELYHSPQVDSISNIAANLKGLVLRMQNQTEEQRQNTTRFSNTVLHVGANNPKVSYACDPQPAEEVATIQPRNLGSCLKKVRQYELKANSVEFGCRYASPLQAVSNVHKRLIVISPHRGLKLIFNTLAAPLFPWLTGYIEAYAQSAHSGV